MTYYVHEHANMRARAPFFRARSLLISQNLTLKIIQNHPFAEKLIVILCLKNLIHL